MIFSAGIPPFEEDEPELFNLQEDSKEDESNDGIGSLIHNRCIRHLDPPLMEAQPPVRVQQLSATMIILAVEQSNKKLGFNW